MTPHQHLEYLLGDLFPTTDELRRRLRHGPRGSEVVDNVPETGTPTQLCHVLVRAINASGLIDRAFFERLEQVRPGLSEDLRKVAVARGVEMAGSPGGSNPEPTPTPPRSYAWLIGLALIVVAIALGWW